MDKQLAESTLIVSKQGYTKGILSTISSVYRDISSGRKIIRIGYELDLTSVPSLKDYRYPRTVYGYFDFANFELPKIIKKWWACFNSNAPLPSLSDLWKDIETYNLIGKSGYIHYVIRANNHDIYGAEYLVPERFLTAKKGFIAKPKNAKNYADKKAYNWRNDPALVFFAGQNNV